MLERAVLTPLGDAMVKPAAIYRQKSLNIELLRRAPKAGGYHTPANDTPDNSTHSPIFPPISRVPSEVGRIALTRPINVSGDNVRF